MMPSQPRISAMSSFRGIVPTVACALALLAPTLAWAFPDYEVSEARLLPTFCKYTQDYRERVPGGKNPDEIERWTRLMGPTFNNMHHYCYGLMEVNRAAFSSKTELERTHNLSNSIIEFDYVLRGAPADFYMLPEILTRKGESLVGLDRGREGILEFQRAIGIDANYAPAYAAMSDYYKRAGQPAKAKEWLEKGLSVSPNSRPLQRRMAELDGSKNKRAAPGPSRKPAGSPPPE